VCVCCIRIDTVALRKKLKLISAIDVTKNYTTEEIRKLKYQQR